MYVRTAKTLSAAARIKILTEPCRVASQLLKEPTLMIEAVCLGKGPARPWESQDIASVRATVRLSYVLLAQGILTLAAELKN